MARTAFAGFTIAVSVAATSPAHAQAAGCRLPAIATGIVERIVDHRTIALADGRQVLLSGIDIPASRAADVVAELGRLILAKSVVLKGTSAADRYGRLAAQVFVGSEGLERSVQHDMVSGGLARVAARVGDGACAAELLALERAARAARHGIWADPQHAVHRAQEPAAILAERGRFALVEGTVLSVRESGGTIYVNFGRRWSEDFTATIAKRSERMFAAAGMEPKRLERRRVRVRGVIEERGGPWIEVTEPAQIEVLAGN